MKNKSDALEKDFPRRLRSSIEFSNLKSKQLAEMSGIQPSHLSHIIKGNRLPSYPVLTRLALALSPWVSANYLLLGE